MDLLNKIGVAFFIISCIIVIFFLIVSFLIGAFLGLMKVGGLAFTILVFVLFFGAGISLGIYFHKNPATYRRILKL